MVLLWDERLPSAGAQITGMRRTLARWTWECSIKRLCDYLQQTPLLTKETI